jgi:GNAT superfamily N-acetyltransferase
MRLRHALRADLPTIVDVWVDAFARDPYLRWIAPGDDDWATFGPAWLGFIAGHCFERGHTFLDDESVVAVAWIPPDLALVGPDDIAVGRGIIEATAGTARADEALQVILAARGHALEEPHWTLQYVGVRSGHQSGGRGAAAVAPILRVCDETHLPCGLVSSNPRNVPFYERHGFVVAAEVTTPDGAATLRPMVRAAT